jgi:plasmid stabilization system protein ParE
MNAERGFKLHPDAASDITSIWEFIAKDNLLAAKRVREDILDAIRRLVPFPHQGHQRRDLTSRPVRFQTVRNYLIAYAPDEEPLLELSVLDGRRGPRVLAAILRGRNGISPSRNKYQLVRQTARAATRTPLNPWETQSPLCVGRVLS